MDKRGRFTFLHLLHGAFDAAQDMFGFLDCKCTFLSHVQALIQQHSQALLDKAVVELFISQPAWILGVSPTHTEHLVLGLLKLHEILMDPLLELVRVSLDGFHPPGVLTAPLSLVSSANLLRVHSVPLSM